MTTTTMPAIARPVFSLHKAALWLLLAFVAALQLSIAIAGILLTAALIAWAALLVRDRARPSAPAFMVPLAVYAAATLVSAVFSLDAAASIVDSKQLAERKGAIKASIPRLENDLVVYQRELDDYRAALPYVD